MRDEFFGQLGTRSLIQLADKRHPLLEYSQLSVLELSDDVASGWGIREALALHQVEEAADGVLLLDPVEPHHCILPLLIKHLVLFGFPLHAIIIELVILHMLLSVALALMVNPVLDQLIDLWSQEEGDVN